MIRFGKAWENKTSKLLPKNVNCKDLMALAISIKNTVFARRHSTQWHTPTSNIPHLPETALKITASQSSQSFYFYCANITPTFPLGHLDLIIRPFWCPRNPVFCLLCWMSPHCLFLHLERASKIVKVKEICWYKNEEAFAWARWPLF